MLSSRGTPSVQSITQQTLRYLALTPFDASVLRKMYCIASTTHERVICRTAWPMTIVETSLTIQSPCDLRWCWCMFRILQSFHRLELIRSWTLDDPGTLPIQLSRLRIQRNLISVTSARAARPLWRHTSETLRLLRRWQLRADVAAQS